MAAADARPRVAALGGGHGLAATLEAARRYAGDITAIVSVADDGGSSGRLRQSLGIPAPGDVRKCLVALARDPQWSKVLEHRFDAGDLEGHALGNLLIAGLTAVTGSFPAAIAEAGRLVGACGTVLPATLGPVSLKAEVGDGEVEGQVRVAGAESIAAVSLVPPDASAPPEAVEAILEADQVLLGPGSLFTSVLAAAVVGDIRDALARTSARKVYVCNLRPQAPETAGFDAASHVRALVGHGVEPDVMLCHPGALPTGSADVEVVERPVARADGLVHDPVQLAAALADLVG